MKKQILCGLICCFSFVRGQTKDNSELLELNKEWTFNQVGHEKWFTATVPGTVHQDLIRHQLLPNPFYGTNEKKIQWVENEDWQYKTTFIVTPEQLERDAAQLTFEGLDTYADVFLNGSLILKSDNMFVGYSVPVKEVLRKGENRLNILFHSPIKQTLPQWESNGFNYPADNDHHDKRVSIFSRKAPYSYGWDWGIRMVTSGIWRPISLRFYDVATIDDYHLKQLSLTDQLATLSNELEITSISDKMEDVELIIKYSLEGGMRYCFEAHRRNRPYCMGTLYWQLNDSWPVVSWSGIDYHGNWKALHYQARRAFAPLLINSVQEKENLNIYLLSDKLESLSGLMLDMQLTDFNGKVLAKQTAPAEVPNNTSVKVLGRALNDWADETQRKNCFLLITLKDKSGHPIAKDVHYFTPTKNLNLPQTNIAYKVKTQDGQCEVTLQSTKLAKDVFIQIPFQGARFSDNFFDLLPGESRKIIITSPEIKKESNPAITVKHIRETY